MAKSRKINSNSDIKISQIINSMSDYFVALEVDTNTEDFRLSLKLIFPTTWNINESVLTYPEMYNFRVLNTNNTNILYQFEICNKEGNIDDLFKEVLNIIDIHSDIENKQKEIQKILDREKKKLEIKLNKMKEKLFGSSDISIPQIDNFINNNNNTPQHNQPINNINIQQNQQQDKIYGRGNRNVVDREPIDNTIYDDDDFGGVTLAKDIRIIPEGTELEGERYEGRDRDEY